MPFMQFYPAKRPLKGTLRIPGDKSVSHRAVMLGALAEGTTEITHFLESADCLSTIDCFRAMGVSIERVPEERETAAAISGKGTAGGNGTVGGKGAAKGKGAANRKDVTARASERVLVHGRGLYGLLPPKNTLYTGNSGTTTRILSGILAPQRFTATLTGDASIEKRPMGRVVMPLTQMGARIESLNPASESRMLSAEGSAPSTGKNNSLPKLYAPLRITGAPLHGITYASPVASAQVKSAILLAGLYADGKTTIIEPVKSRDHTERMLRMFGVSVEASPASDRTGDTRAGFPVTVSPAKALCGQKIDVPADISSAAYFIAAALLVPHSELLLPNVGVNPTRDGFLRVVEKMGGKIEYLHAQGGSLPDTDGEPVADLLVRGGQTLHGITIEGDIIPSLIDELPIIAVLAAYAEGTTIIRDAAELRVKESDRIAAVTEGLAAMGCDIEGTEDGFVIRGGAPLHGADIDSRMDHRIAMSFAVASLSAEGVTQIKDAECVNISFPSFYEDLRSLGE